MADVVAVAAVVAAVAGVFVPVADVAAAVAAAVVVAAVCPHCHSLVVRVEYKEWPMMNVAQEGDPQRPPPWLLHCGGWRLGWGLLLLLLLG